MNRYFVLFLRKLKGVKKQPLSVVTAFAAVLLVVTLLIIALAHASFKPIREASDPVPSAQQRQDEFVARMFAFDRAALDEYREWIRATNGIVEEYKASKSLTFWFFPKPYDPYRDGFRSNLLVIDGIDVFLSVDLGGDRLAGIGTKSGDFFFKKNIRGYTHDSADASCEYDQSVYRVGVDGKMTKVVTEQACKRGGAHMLIFHARNQGEDDLIFDVQQDPYRHGYLWLASSGTHMSIPGRSPILGDSLSSFVLESDMSFFSFPVWRKFSPESATTTVFLRPKPRLDAKSEAISNCDVQWEFSLAGLKEGNKATLGVFERCMEVLDYPFKKLPIPGTDSYYGFVGNGWSDAYPDRAWCRMDEGADRCMLYLVEKGVPKMIINQRDRAKSDPASLLQLEPINARADGSILTLRLPYEIMYFQDYEYFDFIHATSVAQVISYSGGWEDASPTLTFSFPGRKVQLVVEYEVFESAANTILVNILFDGQKIAYFKSDRWPVWGESFPDEEDLRTYALQSDKTKFYFSAGGEKYTLDLQPAVPKLIKR